MSRIDNPNQLAQLRLQYAAAEGALAAANAATSAANQLARKYVENIAMLTGDEIGEGDQIHVDWSTGEVTVARGQESLHTHNGVAV